MERLSKEGVLPDLDFSDFNVYVDCVRAKLIARASKRKRARKEIILELIHTNVYRPILPSVMQGFKYFITFIGDHSKFGWMEPFSEKFEALDAFKKFKATIELKLGKLIKCVHLDKGGEFYGWYYETGRNLGLLAKYLEEYGIKVSYTMPDTLEQNGIVERRNRTLIEMV